MIELKSLVACYSRTGNTESVGKEIAKRLQAGFEPIIDTKKRSGPIGWVLSGKDAMRENRTEIRFSRDPKEYDLLVLGTPVNAGRITPAIRAFLQDHDLAGKQLAFFVTSKSGDVSEVFESLRGLAEDSNVIATLSLLAEEIEAGTHLDKIQGFVDEIEREIGEASE